jgi:hypothetical protein
MIDRITEDVVANALSKKYPSPQYAFLTHVRNSTGYGNEDGIRTAGAHEIKEIFIIDPKPLEPYEFIGGSKLVGEKMVIPKFSGSYMGQTFVEGQQILLAPEVINTVGQDNFIYVKSKKI